MNDAPMVAVDASRLDPDEQDPATAVAAAYIHDGDTVEFSFHHSYKHLWRFDTVTAGRLWRGGEFAIRCGTDGLADARNMAVRDFLRESPAHWLWWVDTDMGFAADTVERLLEAADPVERPVVGGLCFQNRDVENDGMGGRRTVAAPMILEWQTYDGESGFDVRWDYPLNTVVKCQGIGSACVLVHRSVLEKIRDTFGESWYTRTRNPSTGQMISEDLSFCVRVNALNIPIHVHTGVTTTHAKRLWLGEEDYWRQRALNPPPPGPDEGPPVVRDWTVPRYAIIPTHNRPALLTALVASMGKQCDHIVVVDNASSPPVDAEKLQGVAGEATLEVIRDEEQPPNLARLWNVMFDACAKGGHEQYDIAVLNDDAVVPHAWYGACAAGLREHPSAVIAHTAPTTPALMTELGNDPGNRMCPHAFVIRGEVGMRADETMRWWYFDSDLDQRARRGGGVLSVIGPRVANSRANTTTSGVLAEQASRDKATFDAKWGLS